VLGPYDVPTDANASPTSNIEESHMGALKPLVLAIGVALAWSACGPATDTTASGEGALKAAVRAYPDAYNAGDVETIVALFAEDGALMAPNEPAANGHAAIRASVTAQTTGAKAAGVKLVAGASTTHVAGDMGWESGSYSVTDASGTVDSGNYLIVAHKSNGKWLYDRVTYNSDRPLPAASPAAERK
jgi:ketosteroid isomerase-like protein